MMRWPYIQSSAQDLVNPKKALERFNALDVDLATIGAKRRPFTLMVHDEMRIEVDCPVGREAEAQAMIDKHFPSE